MGAEHADVQHQVDAGLGDLGGEPLHQLDELEAQVGGAVAPARLEGESVVAVGQLLKAPFGQRRAGAVAHQLFDAVPLSGAESDPSVQVEAVELGAE
jgi:hypothetical protein